MIADIARRRLTRQLLSCARRKRPEDVVHWLGAAQAQEYGPAKWALAQRLPAGTTDAAVEQAFTDGRILRTHVMRPTWHFVAAADIRRLDIDAPLLGHAMAVFERALRDRCYLTRSELRERLRDSGLAVDGIRL